MKGIFKLEELLLATQRHKVRKWDHEMRQIVKRPENRVSTSLNIIIPRTMFKPLIRFV